MQVSAAAPFGICPGTNLIFRGDLDQIAFHNREPRSNKKTHVEKKIDEGVVATVGHGQPVHAEPDDVDVRISENVDHVSFFRNFIHL